MRRIYVDPISTNIVLKDLQKINQHVCRVLFRERKPHIKHI